MSKLSKYARLKRFFREDFVPYFNVKNKKPLRIQLSEAASLYRKYNVLPYQYMRSRLYKLSAPEDVLSYLPPKLISDLQDSWNDKTHLNSVCNKYEFRKLMESGGIPVVREILRVLPSGVIHDADQNEISRKNAEQLLIEHGGSVFVKTTRGSFGLGAFIHDVSQPADDLFKDSVDRLVQPLVAQHDTLKSLHPASLNTVRIDTLLDNGQCFHNASVLKMGLGGVIVDNSRVGSLVCGIDMKTGRLFQTARRKAIFSQGEYEYHPDTGIAFASVTIPFWKEVIDLTSRAAQLLPQLRTLGWDVAITPTGPVLLEANAKWNVNLMQDGWGGLGTTRIGRLAVGMSRS